MTLLTLFGAGVASTTPTYSINAGTAIHGVNSVWERQVKRVNVDNTIDYLPGAVNIWTLPVCNMTTWETLIAARGAALTSLETNNIYARNSARTYSVNVFFEELSAGDHQGLNMLNVTCRFRVDV